MCTQDKINFDKEGLPEVPSNVQQQGCVIIPPNFGRRSDDFPPFAPFKATLQPNGPMLDEVRLNKALGYLDMRYVLRTDGYIEFWDTDRDVIVAVLEKDRLHKVASAFSELSDLLLSQSFERP